MLSFIHIFLLSDMTSFGRSSPLTGDRRKRRRDRQRKREREWHAERERERESDR